MRRLCVLIHTAVVLSCITSVHGAGIVYNLRFQGSANVAAGSSIKLQVRATFTDRLTGAGFLLSATGDAGATLTARSAAPLEPNGLSYISRTSQSPFFGNLPQNIKTQPVMEALLDLNYQVPGTDGVLPGTDVLIEELTIVPSGTGILVISLSNASGVTTAGAPNGVLLEPVAYGVSSIEFFVMTPPVCRNPRFDVDADGDVDLIDYAVYQACFTGSGDPRLAFAPNPCACLDDDGDRDVDATDLMAFEACALGPGVPANPACDD